MTLGPSYPAATAQPLDPTTAYSTLGLDSGCSQDEISRAYKLLAARYHPDRPKGDALLFSQITAAMNCLSTPVTRALYDIDIGVVEDSDANHAKIHRLRRQEALTQLKLMFNRVHCVTQREQARNGLLIVSAKYGDVSDNGNDRVLDVTMQLQSLVNDSLLIIRDGASKSWIEGFYDPTQGGENSLYCVYRFQGRLHAVTVDDFEELVIPQQAHVMEDRQVRLWESQFSLHSDRLQDMAVKRRRRYIALAGLTAAGVGAYVYYRNKQSQSSTTSNGSKSSLTLVPGIGGLTAGSKQLASIVSEWLELLAEYTKSTLQSFYTHSATNPPPAVLQLGSGLVKTNSALWTNEKFSLSLTQ